jgi:hypothetical protein
VKMANKLKVTWKFLPNEFVIWREKVEKQNIFSVFVGDCCVWFLLSYQKDVAGWEITG